jgi:hypothetical protein
VKKSRTIFYFFMDEALETLTKAKAELGKQNNRLMDLTERLLPDIIANENNKGNEGWTLKLLNAPEPQTISDDLGDTADYDQAALDLGRIIDAIREGFSTVVGITEIDDDLSLELRDSYRRNFKSVLNGIGALLEMSPKISTTAPELKNEFEGLRVLSKIE